MKKQSMRKVIPINADTYVLPLALKGMNLKDRYAPILNTAEITINMKKFTPNEKVLQSKAVMGIEFDIVFSLKH